MPRNWKRKTEKAQWSAKDLSNAVQEVENGESQRKAAKKYNIPFSSFQQRYKKQQSGGPTMGRKPVFTKEQEAEITNNAKTLANMYYGLSPMQLRKLVFEYADQLKMKHMFNKESRMAGQDWLEGFLRRNPSLSVRKPEAISLNRIKGFNRDEVSLFFENLEKVMVKYSFSPHNKYNMDETGFTTVQETGKIIGIKGQKRIGAVTSGERGKTTTVICCMNGAGGFVPPMFIYARQRMTPTLEVNGPLGSVYTCSANGWTNEELFTEWLKHFNNYAKPSKEGPVLLILDNHGSHITLEAYTFCRNNNIIMLSLPPHSSHRLQPLDVVFYGPLKRAYNRECDLHMKSKPGEPITVYKIAELVNKAYSNIATIAKGVSGFASTGIYPMNPNIFSEEDFPFDVRNDSDHENSQGTNATFVQVDSQNNRQPLLTTNGHSPTSEQEQFKSTSFKVSFNQISPIPGPSKVSKIATRKQHSIIITETPEKYVLEEKEEKRCQREKRKRSVQKDKRVKRRVCSTNEIIKINKRRKAENSSSESEIDQEDLCQDSSDDELQLSGLEKNSPKRKITIEQNPVLEINDFIVVSVSNDKCVKQFFAQIREICLSGITVKFMRPYRGQQNIFVFPNVDDISKVHNDDIVGKLTPEKQRYGKIKFL